MVKDFVLKFKNIIRVYLKLLMHFIIFYIPTQLNFSTQYYWQKCTQLTVLLIIKQISLIATLISMS